MNEIHYWHGFKTLIGAMLAASAVILCVLAVIAIAEAQAVPWHDARLSWTAPTSYKDGSPIGTAPISYRVEHQPPGATTWIILTPSPITARTLMVTNLQRGVHTFRAYAIVGGVSSDPSSTNGKDIVNPPPVTIILTVE